MSGAIVVVLIYIGLALYFFRLKPMSRLFSSIRLIGLLFSVALLLTAVVNLAANMGLLRAPFTAGFPPFVSHGGYILMMAVVLVCACSPFSSTYASHIEPKQC